MDLIIILIVCIITGGVVIIIYKFWQDLKLLKTVTRPTRGTRSERKMVISLLKNGFPPQNIFHDLYLERKNGNYTQIDLVVTSDVGIIVFEIKEYKGWIFGTGHQRYWTQVLAYGQKKYRFYNPILQNKKHIEDLANVLSKFEKVPIYSVVVFFGNCEFKDVTFIPNDVFLAQSCYATTVIKQILIDKEPVEYIYEMEIVKVLKAAVVNGENNQIREQHIRNVQTIINRARSEQTSP
nr:NERD domain-containing protein [Chitinophagaceae bacterium]